jgi:hypothetical protein
MAFETLHAIETEFARLPPEAQLGLLERLVHRVRVAMVDRQDAWAAELSTMAADSQVQGELRHINAEFEGTEADGLNES